MGQVLPFTRDKVRVAASSETASLLATLSGSSDVWWGGWAELSPTGGVAVIRHGHFLGLWVQQGEGFAFFPASGEGPPTFASDLDDAYRKTLAIVGADAPQAQSASVGASGQA